MKHFLFFFILLLSLQGKLSAHSHTESVAGNPTALAHISSVSAEQKQEYNLCVSLFEVDDDDDELTSLRKFLKSSNHFTSISSLLDLNNSSGPKTSFSFNDLAYPSSCLYLKLRVFRI